MKTQTSKNNLIAKVALAFGLACGLAACDVPNEESSAENEAASTADTFTADENTVVQATIQTAFNAKVQLAPDAETPVTITGVSFGVEFTPISRAMIEQKIHGVDRIQIVVNPAAPSN